MTAYQAPKEIKGVTFQSVKCIKCKSELFVRLTEKVCPVCGVSLPKRGRS